MMQPTPIGQKGRAADAGARRTASPAVRLAGFGPTRHSAASRGWSRRAAALEDSVAITSEARAMGFVR